MRAPLVVMCLAVVALGCERRPARDPSSGSTATTTTTTTYSSTIDGTPRPPADGHDATSGARGLEQQGPDASMTWGASGNTSARTRADPNAKQGDAQGDTKNADSTKSDDEDRSAGSLGAVDRGSSSSETKITADIRKRLVVSSTLSFSAKNVEVITTGSKVTLRGTVKSEEEKGEIEGIAMATNGVTEVDDQLEVKK